MAEYKAIPMNEKEAEHFALHLLVVSKETGRLSRK